jgi:predicted HTH transcriptional regulator
MKSLILVPETTHLRPVSELIPLGESYTLEFKSTLQWDLLQNRVNSALRSEVIKTIAAFLNSEGGTLVIGVEDEGTICGVEPDLKSLGGSRDRFEQLLSGQVVERLGALAAPYYKLRFEQIKDRAVCVVDVERAPEPVFAKGERGREFFVRVGNTTRTLDPEDSHRYIEMRGAGD